LDYIIIFAMKKVTFWLILILLVWLPGQATEKEIPIKATTVDYQTLSLGLFLVDGKGYLCVEDLGKIFGG